MVEFPAGYGAAPDDRVFHALVVRARGLKPTDKFSSTADPYVALRCHAREAALPAPVLFAVLGEVVRVDAQPSRYAYRVFEY